MKKPPTKEEAKEPGPEDNPHPPGSMPYQLWEASKKMKKPPTKEEAKEPGPNENPHPKGTMSHALWEAT